MLTLTATIRKQVESVEQAEAQYRIFKERVEAIDSIKVTGHISGDMNKILEETEE